MKVLILSCDTGGGHISAAKALTEVFEKKGDECVTVNALRFLSALEETLITRGHIFLYRNAPFVFAAGYRISEIRTPRIIYAICAGAAQRLYEYIIEGQFERVVCVHILPALMMTHIRRVLGATLPVYFVATDYTCSPGVDLTEMDRYFIPENFSGDFCEKGVPRAKIRETGIPVAEKFSLYPNKDRARKILGLNPEGKIVLLAGGSMGCGPMEKIARHPAKNLSGKDCLVVICGSNRKMFERIRSLRLPSTLVIGYTKRIELYMDAADLMLTKPGGLTITEAMTKKLPMICINAVGGLELRNLTYLTQNKYALTENSPRAIAKLASDILSDPRTSEEIIKNMASCGAGGAARKIVDVIKYEKRRIKRYYEPGGRIVG